MTDPKGPSFEWAMSDAESALWHASQCMTEAGRLDVVAEIAEAVHHIQTAAKLAHRPPHEQLAAPAFERELVAP